MQTLPLKQILPNFSFITKIEQKYLCIRFYTAMQHLHICKTTVYQFETFFDIDEVTQILNIIDSIDIYRNHRVMEAGTVVFRVLVSITKY